MRLQDFPTVTLRKFRTPSTWGAIFAYGLFWTALRFMTDLPRGLSLGTEILVPFLLLGGNVALAPLPWLWTGDTRKQAPPLRGFLQCLPWNAIWLLGLTWLLIQMAPMPLGQQQNLHLFLLGRHFVLRPEWGLFFFNYPFALILGWFLADKERAEASERELQILADRTRAQALQAQLNPHVLFNVLGGLTELVHEDPDAAEEALVGLVEMYRDLMKHGTTLRDPLKQERALLKRYLGIEAIRLGERLKVEWAWPDWADALELPPPPAPAPGGERHQARHLDRPGRRNPPGGDPPHPGQPRPESGQHRQAPQGRLPGGHRAREPAGAAHPDADL